VDERRVAKIGEECLDGNGAVSVWATMDEGTWRLVEEVWKEGGQLEAVVGYCDQSCDLVKRGVGERFPLGVVTP
jgi:hypothetical protein